MLTQDQCFSQLKAIIEAKNPEGLDLAQACIADFLAGESPKPFEAAIAMGHLQGRLVRGMPASPLRADVLDLIGDRVAALLEDDD